MAKMSSDEAYDVLGIAPGTNYVAAHRAYRAKARASHPDKATPEVRLAAADEMSRINAAWSVVRAELRPPAIDATEPVVATAPEPAEDVVEPAERHEVDDDQPAAPAEAPATDEADDPFAPAPPTHRRSRRTLVAVAAAAVVAVGLSGLALAVGTSGGGASPDDYLGACLTESGDVVDCSAAEATVEVTETVPSGKDCDGQVFSSAAGDAFFCTTARTS